MKGNTEPRIHFSWHDYPLLLKEVNLEKNKHHTMRGKPIEVLQLSIGTMKKIDWICDVCSNEWSAPGDRRKRGGGCPACSGYSVHSDGRNSLANEFPILAEEFQGDASLVVSGSNKRSNWKCAVCDNEWSSSITNRTKNKSGCPACYGNALHSDGRNSMAATHPHLAEEYQGDATKIMAGAHKKLNWKCAVCDNEWIAMASSRKTNGHGCPYCAGQAMHSDGRNSMKSTHPELAEEYLGDASAIVAGTGLDLDWKCKKCAHEWVARGASRVDGNGCPACANKEVHVDGRNSMQKTHPTLASEYVGDATKIIAGTHERLDWICTSCNHKWSAVGSSRTQGHGCPACAPTGFQPHLSAYYYVHSICNELGDHLFFKCGIARDWQKRLIQLRGNLPAHLTIENKDVMYFENGSEARSFETKMLKIKSIRSPKRDFDGGNELFCINPLRYVAELE